MKETSLPYRYSLIEQNFPRNLDHCVLVFQDHKTEERLHVNARYALNDAEFLSELHPEDIKTMVKIDTLEELQKDNYVLPRKLGRFDDFISEA